MSVLPPAPGGKRLDHFLAENLPEHSRSRLADLIARGGVLVDGVRAPKAGHKLKGGEAVTLAEEMEPRPSHLEPVAMELDVRYEDDDLLVVNKERGLAVHPAPGSRRVTLVHGLLARAHGLSEGSAEYRPGLVHRLDKQTTGLILVAKRNEVHERLASDLRHRLIERRYAAIVKGQPRHAAFTVDAPLGRDPKRPLARAVVPEGKAARTHFRVVKRLDQGSLVIARLETGRTHQIRVHLASVGHPVMGDELYAPAPYSEGPLQLHAGWLRFPHPVRESTVTVYAPPPEDFVGMEWVSEKEGWR